MEMESSENYQIHLLIMSLVEATPPIPSSTKHVNVLTLIIDFVKNLFRQRQNTISHFSTPKEVQVCISITRTRIESFETEKSLSSGILDCIKALSSSIWHTPPLGDPSSTGNAFMHAYLQFSTTLESSVRAKRIASQWCYRNNSLTFVYHHENQHLHRIESRIKIKDFLKQLDLLIHSCT
uniref:AlNc14C118G6594 protein n=1 Tax=Albugo laibachii Nc14 TaxID=890382 RepID=F0WJ62_9STRA|nr:AlNc14C118G6594 [Albugo laibachii Nc14]|eukprot:CCA21309.1 AlNc14C118G6594 [Albugo laibachii Nc14]